MAYKEPDTAVHHLQMAQSYINEVQTVGEKEKNANKGIADQQIQILANAAAHLNKARATDPSEVLWVDDEKEKTKFKVDQDYLNGKVLLLEGVAHLNAAIHISNYYSSKSARYRPVYEEGTRRLQQARDALEMAHRYSPYSDDVLGFLAKTYHRLGDSPNYRRVLERHLEISPEKMELHKEIKEFNLRPRLSPLFVEPPFNYLFLFKVVLWLLIPLGFVIGIIGGANNINWLGGTGVLVAFGSIGILYLMWTG